MQVIDLSAIISHEEREKWLKVAALVSGWDRCLMNYLLTVPSRFKTIPDLKHEHLAKDKRRGLIYFKEGERWTIPLDMYKRMREISRDSPYLFPAKNGRQMSDQFMSYWIGRMNKKASEFSVPVGNSLSAYRIFHTALANAVERSAIGIPATGPAIVGF